MLKLSLLSILLLLTVSCSSSIHSIKKQYYNIDTINGIDRKEATTTALYHALMDNAFETSSAKNISAIVVNKRDAWLVNLTHKPSNKTANYLINKKSGNTKSQSERTAPVKFFSSFNENRVKVKINPLDDDSLPEAIRFDDELINEVVAEKENINYQDKNNVFRDFDAPQKEAKSETDTVIAFFDAEDPADNPKTISDEDPGHSFELPRNSQKTDEKPILTFDYLESLKAKNKTPDPSINIEETDGKTAIAFYNAEDDLAKNSSQRTLNREPDRNNTRIIVAELDGDKRISIDSDDFISILSSNDRISSRRNRKPTSRPRPRQETSLSSSPGQGTISTNVPSNISNNKSKSTSTQNKQRANTSPEFVDAFPRADSEQLQLASEIRELQSTEFVVESEEIPVQVTENQNDFQDIFKNSASDNDLDQNQSITSSTLQDFRDQPRGEISREFSQPEFTQEFTQETTPNTQTDTFQYAEEEKNLGGEISIAFYEDEASSRSTPVQLAGVTVENRQPLSNNQTIRIIQSQPANTNNTSTMSDSPTYDLKLLTSGFDSDIGNHITLKADHDMDFSEDLVDFPTEDEPSTYQTYENDISSEIAREAIQRVVETPQAMDQFADTEQEEIDDIFSTKTDRQTIESQRQEIARFKEREKNARRRREIEKELEGLKQTERSELERFKKRERNKTRKEQIEKEIAELSARRDMQLARLSKRSTPPPSMDLKIVGDTVTVLGAYRGNRGIVRMMKVSEVDGVYTRVAAFKLNGRKISQLTKNLELTPGKHTLTSRCYSSDNDDFDRNTNAYENTIEVVIENAHEYLLEAQTYQFDGQTECAASIYDLRDAR